MEVICLHDAFGEHCGVHFRQSSGNLTEDCRPRLIPSTPDSISYALAQAYACDSDYVNMSTDSRRDLPSDCATRYVHSSAGSYTHGNAGLANFRRSSGRPQHNCGIKRGRAGSKTFGVNRCASNHTDVNFIVCQLIYAPLIFNSS